MERNKEGSVVMWALVAALLCQNLIIPVMGSSSVEDQKTYYSPDPHHAGTPPISHGTPPSHSGSYGTPPSHGGTPHCHCGGTPSSGGHHPSPSTPTPTLTPPSGYTYSPPVSGGGTPSTPVTFTPPSSPIIVPGTPIPGISIPSPPYVIDPNSPPFSCNYWRTHPTLIWGLFGWFGTVGGAFSLSSVPNLPSIPGLGSSTTLQQCLANVRTDGYGTLYREGTAALLNSMIDHKFPFTTSQVRDNFVSAIRSNKAAATQGHVFKLANEGRLKN